jgi:hypothetical protein
MRKSVYADQVSIERRMMDLGQRQAIRDDRLPKLLVRIHTDVSGIQQAGFGQVGDGTSSPTTRVAKIRTLPEIITTPDAKGDWSQDGAFSLSTAALRDREVVS